MNYHGGDIYKYKNQLLDFSSNINPLGVPELFKEKLSLYIDDFTKYPDIDYMDLRTSIAKYLGVNDIESIVAGNGAVELIYKSLAALSCAKAFVLSPTFAEYGSAALQSGMELIRMAEYDHNIDCFNIDKIISHVCKDSVMIICNPNNPTGSFISLGDMCKIAEALKSKGSFLIIDEAFIEFTEDYPNNSMINCLSLYDNVTIIRAATKFFGMPGIRLGYGISYNKGLISRVRALLEPWNVNTAAVIAGKVIFSDVDYIEKSRQWIKSERNYLFKQLSRINDIKTYKSSSNYHLIKLLNSDIDAWSFKKLMVEEGILVRTPEGFGDLTSFHVRLAVKDRRSNEMLVKAIKAVLGGSYVSE